MKKIICFSGVLFLLIFRSFAQEEKPKSQEEKIKKLRIDAFYGGPNLVSRIIEAVTIDNATTTTSSFGPIGVRGEYFLEKYLSIGLEVHHASSGYKRQITENVGSQRYSFRDELIINRTRIYPRLALHLGVDRIDAYWFGAFGYALWTSNYTVTENTNNYFSEIEPVRVTRSSGIAIRTGIGFRYFFTDNFGINADIGLGGPLVTAGLSARF